MPRFSHTASNRVIAPRPVWPGRLKKIDRAGQLNRRRKLEAGERAFSHGPAIFAEGQAKGEVTAGDPSRLSLVVFAALQGLIAISSHGKFKGVSLDTLVPEMTERIILGLRATGRP